MEIPFWDKSVETIDRSDLEKLQLAGLKRQVENALKTSFYKDKLLKEGIIGGSSIRTLDDIRKLPFTTKTDLREAYPFGLMGVGEEDVVGIHASSGITGSVIIL